MPGDGGSLGVGAAASPLGMLVTGVAFSLEAASTWPFLSPPVQPNKAARIIDPPTAQIRQFLLRAIVASFAPIVCSDPLERVTTNLAISIFGFGAKIVGNCLQVNSNCDRRQVGPAFQPDTAHRT